MKRFPPITLTRSQSRAVWLLAARVGIPPIQIIGQLIAGAIKGVQLAEEAIKAKAADIIRAEPGGIGKSSQRNRQRAKKGAR